jgi:hypothetical protein
MQIRMPANQVVERIGIQESESEGGRDSEPGGAVNAGTIAFYIWIVFGLAFGYWVDRDEMKKHVPYGSMPSIVPLSQMRKIMYVTCAMLGAPLGVGLVLLYVALEIVLAVDAIHDQWCIWRAKIACRKMCKTLGVRFEPIWVRVLQKIQLDNSKKGRNK